MEALILSRGQDTNGQNARYVEASRKHGNDEGVLSVPVSYTHLTLPTNSRV